MPYNSNQTEAVLSPGMCALLACTAEVLAPKVGNVNAVHSFEDVTWQDFVASAMACRSILDRAAELGVGQTVLQCVQQTWLTVDSNTNLGMILLLAPLSVALDSITDEQSLHQRLGEVLADLKPADATAVYEAIRLVHPGGLGEVPDADVNDDAPDDLMMAMRLADDRDLVARQYVTEFADVFDQILPDLLATRRNLDEAIVYAHLRQIAREPDSLISRKCGLEQAKAISQMAQQVLDGELSHEQFDAFLRQTGNQQNPGTSADLIAAGLFVAFACGQLAMPANWQTALPQQEDEPFS